MQDYLNTNGLVGGKIPAGKLCPFEKVCDFVCKDWNECPVENRVKKYDFSCQKAKIYSLRIGESVNQWITSTKTD